MHDAYAGYRDYSDPFWAPSVDPLWIDWDYALAEAWKVRESFTDDATGQPRWLTDDPDVFWTVDEVVSHAAADLYKAQREIDDEPWRKVYLKDPKKRNDEPFWCIDEWLENLESDNRVIERGAPIGGHAPSAEDMAEMRKRRLEALQNDAP